MPLEGSRNGSSLNEGLISVSGAVVITPGYTVCSHSLIKGWDPPKTNAQCGLKTRAHGGTLALTPNPCHASRKTGIRWWSSLHRHQRAKWKPHGESMDTPSYWICIIETWPPLHCRRALSRPTRTNLEKINFFFCTANLSLQKILERCCSAALFCWLRLKLNCISQAGKRWGNEKVLKSSQRTGTTH